MKKWSFVVIISLCLLNTFGCSKKLTDENKKVLSNTEEFLKKGMHLTEFGDYSRALEEFKKIIDIEPKNSLAWALAGYMRFITDNNDEAIEFLKKSIEHDSSSIPAWGCLARTYIKLGVKEKIDSTLNRFSSLQPKTAMDFHFRSLLFRTLDRPQLYMKDCETALQMDPDNSLYYCERGFANNVFGKFDKALKDYNKAIELNPESSLAYLRIGFLYHHKKDFEKAIDAYTKGININPKNDFLRFKRGITYQGINGEIEALQDYSHAIKLNPKKPEYFNRRGNLYIKMKRYEFAVIDISREIELRPHQQGGYNHRGIALRELEKYDEAVKDFEKAIELYPEFWSAYMNLAHLYEKMNNKEKAIEIFEKAVWSAEQQFNKYKTPEFEERIQKTKDKLEKVKSK